jgi:hypothetical protein
MGLGSLEAHGLVGGLETEVDDIGYGIQIRARVSNLDGLGEGRYVPVILPEDPDLL